MATHLSSASARRNRIDALERRMDQFERCITEVLDRSRAIAAELHSLTRAPWPADLSALSQEDQLVAEARWIGAGLLAEELRVLLKHDSEREAQS